MVGIDHISTRHVNDMLNGIRAVLRKTDRIISGRLDVDVRIDKKPPQHLSSNAGWAQGPKITLNGSVLVPELRSALVDKVVVGDQKKWDIFMMSLKGLNYHELSHVLWTPESKSPLMEKVYKLGLTRSWNILEDQRIEMLFWSRYLPVGPFFSHMVMKWVLANGTNPNAIATDYPFVARRLYLPHEFRKAIRKGYVEMVDAKIKAHQDNGSLNLHGHYTGETYATEVYNLVTEFASYRHIGEKRKPADVDDIIRVIQRFNELTVHDQVGKTDLDSHGQMGSPGSSEPSDDDKEEAGDLAADVEAEDADADARNGKAKPKKSKPVDDKQDASDHGESLDKDAIEKMMADIESDEEVQSDIDDTTESVHETIENSGHVVNFGRIASSETDVLPRDRSTLGKMVEKLLFLRSGLEDQWVLREPRGRLDVRRAMYRDFRPGPPDVFKEWEPSVEAAGGIETVLCMDISSSMVAARLNVAAQLAAYLIKRMHDEIGMGCTVFAYGNQTHLVYGAEERAKVNKWRFIPIGEGNTLPSQCIQEASYIFERSLMPNKVLIIVTDGRFGDTATSDKLVAEHNRNGATTVLVHLGSASGDGKHNCQIVQKFKNPMDLVAMAESLVAEITNSVAANR